MSGMENFGFFLHGLLVGSLFMGAMWFCHALRKDEA